MKQSLCLLFLALICTGMVAQSGKTDVASGPGERLAVDSWQVDVNQMDGARREMITRTVEDLQAQGGATRSVVGLMLAAAGQSALNSMVDIAATEIVKLATYEQTQKKEWLRLVENECNYSDNIASVRNLNDFYSETSRYGAMDPSNMIFDGISVHGVKDGQEVLFLSCHIDESRLDHLFQHGKFFLILDTLAFYPYNCHLPNLEANGIHIRGNEDFGRNNSFSYDERDNLTISMDISISSSWINEAIMIQKDVELGRFKMQLSIPSGTEVYTYSRTRSIGSSVIPITGDSFVVPRSFMPISGTEKMWGTGEYSMSITIKESCNFSQDPQRNGKLKNWKQDYKQLRKMQKKDSQISEYTKTLWKQNGNSFMKSMVKQSLSKGVSSINFTSGGSNSGTSGSAMKGK